MMTQYMYFYMLCSLGRPRISVRDGALAERKHMANTGSSTLKFHRLLPTNGGDGRQVVGGGHGVAAGPSGRPASVPFAASV
jgi:hypothetical protein